MSSGIDSPHSVEPLPDLQLLLDLAYSKKPGVTRSAYMEAWNELDEPLEDLLYSLFRLVGRPPKYLHHYTASASALLGIIESCSLYATSTASLSDSSELVYGQRVIEREFQQLRRGAGAAETLLLGAVADYMNNERLNGGDVYVCCFCADRDSLGHWQVYAQVGSGYCLVFASSGLPLSTRARLLPVIYDANVQRRLIRAVLDVAFDHIGRMLDARSSTIDKATLLLGTTAAVAESLSILRPTFKDPRFATEHEWRLIKRTLWYDEALKFRVIGNEVAPYM